jgi:hypothetical protein
VAEDTLLSSTINARRYLEMERQRDREGIADFIHHRFRERYIIPLLVIPVEEKSGFLILGVSCLLLAALESFYQGWESTEKTKTRPGRSKDAFRLFFSHQWRFKTFQGHAEQFYKNVRCGILHQAETTGGWLIHRSGPLFDEDNLIVNATVFHRNLSGALDDYRRELIRSPWECLRWDNFRNKMKATIKNCEP